MQGCAEGGRVTDAGTCRMCGEHGDEGGVCTETQVGNEKSSGDRLPQGSLAGKSFESAEMKG